MTTRGHPENARSYGVHLANEDHKAMWKRVSARDTVPSRYPHELPLTTLGILEDFWALCNVGDGNGLVHMFQGRWPSYRRLTLEFLSTLKVHKNRRSRIPERIEFRLGNRNHSFSMDELCEVFHCFNPTPGEEVDYDYSDVWGAFTIEGEEFESGYAKSTSFCNPVLRYLHHAMTQLTKVDTWDNQTMWKLNTLANHRAIEANPIQGEFRKRNIPMRIPAFDPKEDSAFDAIENYHEGKERSNAHGGGAPQEDEEEEEEVEGHGRSNRANRRRGRPNANEEFQANTSARLGEMFSYMQNMSNTWDNRWAEQQQENDFNRQGWAAQGDWQTAEQQLLHIAKLVRY